MGTLFLHIVYTVIVLSQLFYVGWLGYRWSQTRGPKR